MASASTLEPFEKRANQADEIINQLQVQISALKAAAVAKACQAEEEKLKRENGKLRSEVEQWKQKLIQAEINNGVVQVPLPAGSVSKVSQPNMAAAKPKVLEIPVSQPPPKQNKQNKKPEKKGESKPKQPGPQATDVPVDVSRLDMRIGQIVNVKKHPDADSLYVEEVNVGEERNRTIVSGLVKHVTLEQMQDRKAIFLLNLKPAKMRGVMSEGMIMCASSPEKVEIIVPPANVEIGDRVIVEGYPGNPDALMNPKKKIFEQVQPDLRISEQGLATYKGALWNVARKGVCEAPTMTNSAIK